MRFRLLSLFAAALLLAACETAPEETAQTGEQAMAETEEAEQPSEAEVSEGAELPGPQPGSQEDLVVEVGDRVFFGFDKYSLTPEARETVEQLAAWMQEYPQVTITVEGHADERGTREYNLALGERRANSVRDYLIALGINADRVSTVSFGEERPAVLGSNEAAWAQNRRAVFKIN